MQRRGDQRASAEAKAAREAEKAEQARREEEAAVAEAARVAREKEEEAESWRRLRPNKRPRQVLVLSGNESF